MSVHMHVTLEVRPGAMGAFCALMEELVPVVEAVGWRLQGAYVQNTGRLNTVIDLWELDDMNHYQRGVEAIGAHAEAARFLATLAETVQSETIVFAQKAPYMAAA
ncbi:MAG: NIPSNAP family protein [Hydrogenophilaceae bacterium]|jgi:hypothetical protein|nr:NIPSNAP family protein [Hydrogenophilaceae bacterium]